MANNYYSGQGSVYTSERDATTGAPLGFMAIGNVPELEISIEVTKYEHKESESGSRAIDLSIVQEKKGTFRMLVENISLENLAMGFWGTTVETAALTAEAVVLTAPSDVSLGYKMAIGGVNVSTVLVGTAAGLSDHTVDVDYTLDAKYGTITPIDGGAIIDDATVHVTYDTAAITNSAIAFTEDSLERYVRFEGLNTIDGSDDVLINMYRVQLDPVSGYSLINEEISQLEITGSLLYDDKQSGASKFFEQIIVT
ncbi:MAG: hypothetical protein DRQ47_00335 [Gammaproteobacteria bacterium]|nr:MAG: hypothetical protein DRQ47_00335 [Gammaproteobacteria bacterium]